MDTALNLAYGPEIGKSGRPEIWVVESRQYGRSLVVFLAGRRQAGVGMKFQ